MGNTGSRLKTGKSNGTWGHVWGKRRFGRVGIAERGHIFCLDLCYGGALVIPMVHSMSIIIVAFMSRGEYHYY